MGERALTDELRTAWQGYIDALVPLRPSLYAYCRRLTGNVWDAEDLAQETLLRAFGQWGITQPEIRNPRAYLLRTATNVWIDRRRRQSRETQLSPADLEQLPVENADPLQVCEVRDAAARLLQRPSPQERAAVVLKDVFDMTLEEIATLLATTPGTVKSALHRGRARLREPEAAATSRRPPPSPELLDRFIELYDARDVSGLVALMLEGSTAENVGNSVHIGLDPVDGVPAFLRAVVHGHPEWPVEFQLPRSRLQRLTFEGEPVILSTILTRRGNEALSSVFRFEEENGRIARIRSYAFCPETIRAVGEMIGMRVLTGIYRAPTPAPGARWPERE
jgi:RNA polymerase sigma-70 factor, ECF subfamily